MSNKINFSQIKDLMLGKEEAFLTQYYGLDSSIFAKKQKQKPCPSCGGKDRFAILKKHGFRFKCGWGAGSAGGDVFNLAAHVSNESLAEIRKNAIEFLGCEVMSPDREREIREIQRNAARIRKIEAFEAQKKKDAVAVEARKMWGSMPEANPDHPYLKSKLMSKYAYKFKQFKNVLVIPVIKLNKIVSLQFISDGKNFLKGSDLKGVHFTWGKIPKDAKLIYIVEGVSTGYAVHEMSKGVPVVCCFTVGNLMNITESLKMFFPNSKLIIAADNDIREEGNTNPNTGVETAKIVSKVTGCEYIVPTIKSGKKCDYHNVFMQHLIK